MTIEAIIYWRDYELEEASPPLQSRYHSLLTEPLCTKRSGAGMAEYDFNLDQFDLADVFEVVQTDEDWNALDDAFDFGLDEIIAAMWDFDGGMVEVGFLEAHVSKFAADSVWHACYLVSRFSIDMQPRFCRAVHILNRLKPYAGVRL
jgi:hypothetical protein